jgi:ABC-2 type transport system permease protein
VRKVWAVIRREFIERVRTKWFVISTVLGPVFMIAMAVLPSLLLMRGGTASHIVLLDEGAGPLAERMRSQLARGGRFNVGVVEGTADRHAALVDSLTLQVRSQQLDGFLVVTGATLEAGSAEYRGRNVSSLRDMGMLEGAVRQAVTVERLARRGVDASVVQEAQAGIELHTLRISKGGAAGASGEATFFLGYALALILYIVTLAYGITVMRSVIQEKQDRIIEVLISSMRPFQLMLGKVVGVGGVGLLQMTIWGAVGLATMRYRVRLLALFGVPTSASSQFQMPALSVELVIVVVVFFLLGYLFYSSLFAVVGAAVNSESEAGQAQQPVMMLLVASLMLSIGALGNPGGQLGVVGSLVPFSAPIVMPVRMATSDVTGPQLLMSLAIMAASTLVVVWVAARVYRIGILMYGKRPGVRELLRWARQS